MIMTTFNFDYNNNSYEIWYITNKIMIVKVNKTNKLFKQEVGSIYGEELVKNFKMSDVFNFIGNCNL